MSWCAFHLKVVLRFGALLRLAFAFLLPPQFHEQAPTHPERPKDGAQSRDFFFRVPNYGLRHLRGLSFHVSRFLFKTRKRYGEGDSGTMN